MSESPEKSPRQAPMWRSHWPVLSVDYEQTDADAGYGDAIFMDIGQSTWDKKDLSAKLWRWADMGKRWSRQSEELPLSRVLDLAILVSAAATGKQSALQEFFQREEQKDNMQAFLTENMQVLGPKLDELRRILQPATQPIEEVGAPNIFSFATSELSQDAMFTWLLSWADSKYQQHDASLHAVALSFVRLLTGINDLEVSSIKADRQWEHIDVWAEINDDVFLAIEDKTGTTIHDEQLRRYKEAVEKEYPNRKNCYAYVKTGNEPKSILQQVKDAGYRIILRKKLLDCLDAYTGDNVVLCNYRDHLRAHEQATQSFRTKPVSEWSWSAWEGFYKELENKGMIDTWGYVSNPSGGFLGTWWHWVDFDEGASMYLQFEQEKLCFKICPDCDKEKRSEVRDKCHYALLQKAKDRFPEIHKPDRFGSGEYMTIAVVDPEHVFGNGIIDIDAVIAKLKQYEQLVDECCASFGK